MTILMRDIFKKPIERPIDGVIKADDEASLRLELEEYVITDEIAKQLELFLDAYNNYNSANGAWISGFFGSGKSHLLKMLALILENRDVGGARAFDIFVQKLGNRPMLAGALGKAIGFPSKSILFNIDQKADVISKTDVDALLSVFQKVFDEMCGYYGKQPHIARFERHLEARGQFSAFKNAFSRIARIPWETLGREQALLEKSNIAAAYAEATGARADDARDILSEYRKDTHVSIEDFANSVKEWVDLKGERFRLNFFVDEVGQYIADNVKLMTNLQTVAESLNTKCRGQAWIIVTAQQALSDVVGDLPSKVENDFSKIQARFANRMPLNSADVAEVIQRRLLAKTDEAEISLGNLFDREEGNLKTLFDFPDGSVSLKNFRDRNHFIISYPFPPYQYALFQMAIQALSGHNAFEGRHSSVGERSMLGVFQEVAKFLLQRPVGGLASFDMMFEGIRTALKSSVQQSIITAENNLDDLYALRVMKALFLVKYVKGFKATARNINILLLSEFNAIQSVERRKIEEALARLERETYIQRIGDAYEFLTNEEKDVEADIKSVDIDQTEVVSVLKSLAFDQVIKLSKIKHKQTNYEFPYSRKIDDQLQNRDYDLSINLISPFSGNAPEDAVKMNGMTRDELAIVLGQDASFFADLMLFKKTEKYIRQTREGALLPSRERIISEKGELNSRREKDLDLRMRSLIVEAKLYIRGSEIDVLGEDPQDRVIKAFQTLVDRVYTNLPMLHGANYAEADIARAADPANNTFGADGAALTEAETEVLNYLQVQAKNALKVSAKALSDKFGSKPYGWPNVATFWQIANLSARGKCEARLDSAVIEGDALAKALGNNRSLENILFSPQTEFTAAQLRKSKELFEALFGQPTNGSDARVLSAKWAEAASNLVDEIADLLAKRTDYPFVVALEPFYGKLKEMRNKPAAWYVLEAVKDEDALLDAKEDVFVKISKFMGGSQREIFDIVGAFLWSNDVNIEEIDPVEGERFGAVLRDLDCYKGSAIQNLKTDFYALKDKVELALQKERKLALDAVEETIVRLERTPECKSADAWTRNELGDLFFFERATIKASTSIARLRERKYHARNLLLAEALKLIVRNPVLPRGSGTSDGDRGFEEPYVPDYVHKGEIAVNFDKAYLASEADVEAYLQELRHRYLAEIGAGRRVVL